MATGNPIPRYPARRRPSCRNTGPIVAIMSTGRITTPATCSISCTSGMNHDPVTSGVVDCSIRLNTCWTNQLAACWIPEPTSLISEEASGPAIDVAKLPPASMIEEGQTSVGKHSPAGRAAINDRPALSNQHVDDLGGAADEEGGETTPGRPDVRSALAGSSASSGRTPTSRHR